VDSPRPSRFQPFVFRKEQIRLLRRTRRPEAREAQKPYTIHLFHPKVAVPAQGAPERVYELGRFGAAPLQRDIARGEATDGWHRCFISWLDHGSPTFVYGCAYLAQETYRVEEVFVKYGQA
jgi:hypothetical protein